MAVTWNDSPPAYRTRLQPFWIRAGKVALSFVLFFAVLIGLFLL